MSFDAAKTAPLEPGDLLLVKTDGITESESPSGEQFGDKRLRDMIQSQPDAAPAELVQSIHEADIIYRDTVPQKDDITILCLRAT